MHLGINDGVAVTINDVNISNLGIDTCIVKSIQFDDCESTYESIDKASLSLNEYQKQAESTAIYPNKGNNIFYPTLGLSGEAGECAEKVKKLIRDHDSVLTDDYREKIAKELGDVLWYVAMLSHEIQYDLQTIAKMNLEKLSSRKGRNQIHGNGDNR